MLILIVSRPAKQRSGCFQMSKLNVQARGLVSVPLCRVVESAVGINLRGVHLSLTKRVRGSHPKCQNSRCDPAAGAFLRLALFEERNYGDYDPRLNHQKPRNPLNNACLHLLYLPTYLLDLLLQG